MLLSTLLPPPSPPSPPASELRVWMQGCRPSRCVSRRSRLPQELIRDLQTNYSLTLYGAKYKIDLSRIRVLWPSLLGAAAMRSLLEASMVQCFKAPHLSRQTHLYFDPPKNNLQSAAVWVHQPNLQHVPREEAAHASYSWVEVRPDQSAPKHSKGSMLACSAIYIQ